MEYLITALEITMALFAVIGIYSLGRLLSQRFFGAKELSLAIEIREEKAAARSEALITEALGQFLLVPSGRVVILTTPTLSQHTALRCAAERYGVPILVCVPDKEEK